MAGRFTFAVPASLSLENHVHIPRGINKSSISIRVGIQPAAVAAVIAREGAHEKRKSTASPLPPALPLAHNGRLVLSEMRILCVYK